MAIATLSRMPRETMTAQTLPFRTEAETALAAQFAALLPTLPGAAAERQAAFADFVASGLPTRRREAWHYSDMRAAMTAALPPLHAPSPETIKAWRSAAAASTPGETRLVVLDGHLVPELCDPLPHGLTLRTPDTEAAELPPAARHDPALSLNLAFATPFEICVAAGTRLANAIRVVSGATAPGAIYARMVVRVGDGASLSLIEDRQGDTRGQAHHATHITIGEGAEVDVVTSAAQPWRVDVATMMIDLGARAHFNGFALVTDADFARRQIFVRYSGEHAAVKLGGLALLRGRNHADTTLVVDHAHAHGESRETFNHIVDDGATGVFQGKIIVAPGAQKTDGKMMSRAILLSDDATMNNKPELEIFADDVVCGHGATCGELDAEQIFYLRSRGLPRREAEALLLEGFAAAAIDMVASEPLRADLLDKARAWLAARAARATVAA